MSFPNVAAGEEVMPEMHGYKMACCDCGLVHTMDFKVREVVAGPDAEGNFTTVEPDNVDKLRVVLTADRDEIATDEERAGVIEYLDKILETQGRLMFAKENYDQAEAELFGFAVLEFMRMNGQIIRTALIEFIDKYDKQ